MCVFIHFQWPPYYDTYLRPTSEIQVYTVLLLRTDCLGQFRSVRPGYSTLRLLGVAVMRATLCNMHVVYVIQVEVGITQNRSS